MPDPQLSEAEFKSRYREHFIDPAFRALEIEIAAIADVARMASREGRKSPLTRKAGQVFHDRDYNLSVDWLAARDAIDRTALTFADRRAASTHALARCRRPSTWFRSRARLF
jgi:hypothetical protein